jgi:hypothetical protein
MTIAKDQIVRPAALRVIGGLGKEIIPDKQVAYPFAPKVLSNPFGPVVLSAPSVMWTFAP